MTKHTKMALRKVSWDRVAAAENDKLFLDCLKSVREYTNPTDTDSIQYTVSRSRKKYLSGWRLSVILCIILVSSIFVLNLGITIWVLNNYTVVQGVATVYEGSCAKTKNYTTLIHLGINVLGSCLLGASNFCMQILCAPTREEIDTAQAKYRWLRIGVASIKNLLYIDRRKTLLWTILGLSSIPLHLFWNSAVIDTLSSNIYFHIAITKNYLDGAPLRPSVRDNLTSWEHRITTGEAETMRDKYKNNSLLVMDRSDCIKAYSQTFVSTYGNVILVYENDGSDTSLLNQQMHDGTRAMDGEEDFGDHWVCGEHSGCNLSELVKKNGTFWNPRQGFDISFDEQNPLFMKGSVEHCLVEKLDHPCRLGMSPPILKTVLACNVVKLPCLILLLWVAGPGHPLVTNGDAIESFLLRPDLNLQGRCLASHLDVRRDDDVRREKSFWSSRRTLPVEWKVKRRRWVIGASKTFWMGTLIPGLILLVTILAICRKSKVWNYGTTVLVASGFRRPSTLYLISGGVDGAQRSPVVASLLANLPHLFVTYIYITYNGLSTSMIATAEWVDFSLRPHGLRVTWPKGQQKMRTFLHLPYTYSIPIICASTMLHWLISQSIFIVRIMIYQIDEMGIMDVI